MKRFKRAIALVAILVVASVATFLLSRYEEKKEQIKSSDEIILEIPSDTVTALSWELEETSLAFHKGDEGWLYDEDEAFPVSEEKVNEILSYFEAFDVSFIIENVEDYDQYGLKDPEGIIHLTTTDSNYEIKLGNFSKMDEQRYVDIGDGNVYLVSKDPMNYIEEELSGMIKHDDTPKFDNVTDITFAGSENYTIFYKEESSYSYHEEDIYFLEKDGKNLPLDTDTVSKYLKTITGLKLNDYVTYNATEEELESFGLNEPELSVSINYTYTDEDEKEVSDSFLLHISQNPEELKAAKDAEEKEKEEIPSVTKYARIGDSQIVYKITDSAYETLAAASYNDFRHKEVIWADFDIVKQIDISLEGNNHTLTPSKNDGKDAETVWSYNEEEVDIDNLKTSLYNLMADSFTDEVPDQKQEIALTIHLDNENFPQVNIELYRYDGNSCLAVVDGKSVSLLERSAVMDLVEAVQAIVLN